MKELPVRKNIRLKDYDYSQAGCYFITICIKDRHEMLWNTPVGAAFGRPPLSATGILVDSEIQKINTIYENVKVDKYVIMPNHIHMIIILSEISGRQSAIECGRPKAAPTISRILNQFKGSVSKQLGYSLWQKLFHDHIIRNQTEYQKIWQYIEDNPTKWQDDCYYVRA